MINDIETLYPRDFERLVKTIARSKGKSKDLLDVDTPRAVETLSRRSDTTLPKATATALNDAISVLKNFEGVNSTATDNIRVDHKWTDGVARFSRGGVGPSKLGDGKQRYYEVPFAKAVDKIVANRRKNGKNAKPISRDYVFVGETPAPLEDIGFVKLPIMMTQHHIETCYFSDIKGKAWGIDGHMHGLGNILKRIPAALQKPVMVIASKSPKGENTSVVAITSVPTPDGDLILPIVINGDPNVDGNRITAHVMTSAHGRKNAWTGLVADALEAEQNGKVGVFYLDKAKASKVFTKLAKANPTLASVGLMYAKEPQADGVRHSITDPDSPVKGQAGLIKDQATSRQFKKWFGKSKVVDENGKPLVVYHGSSWNPMSEQSGKAVFDKSRINEGSLGRVFYFSRTPTDEYGKNLTAVYLSIKNPFNVQSDTERVLSKEESERFYKALDGEVFGEYKPETMGELFATFKDEVNFPEAMKAIGYDGVIDNTRGYIGAFDANQIKSATDNIGTFDSGNNDIRFSIGGVLKRSGKDGKIVDVDQQRLTAVMRGLETGELKHPRFTREEFAASKGVRHERLWSYLLSLESPDIHAGGGQGLDGGKGGNDSQGSKGMGLVRRVATRYGSNPEEVIASRHKYFDKGVESKVYVTGGDTVIKVRKLNAYDLDGVKHELAKIVYHNYLFPNDAYTLRDIAVWNKNGYDQFYLIVEQPLVRPKIDANGNIIAPSEEAILKALNSAGRRFSQWDEARNRRAADVDDDLYSSDDDFSSDDFVASGRKMAYNDEFVVYDFKPGRNTFIDAETGEIRFIDPRVDINDPGAGFSVSKFGKRKIDNRSMTFDGSPSNAGRARFQYVRGVDWSDITMDIFKFVPEGTLTAMGETEQSAAGLAGAIEKRGALRPWTKADSPAANAKPIAFDAADMVMFWRAVSGSLRNPHVQKGERIKGRPSAIGLLRIL